MLRSLYYIFLYLSLTLCSSVVEPPDKKNYYRAGVVQYYPNAVNGDNDRSEINVNIKYYEMFIKTAAQLNADIIVFPEYGLTAFADYPHTDAHFLSDKYEGSYKYEYELHKANLENSSPRHHKYTTFAAIFRKMYSEIASAIPDPKDKILPCRNDTFQYSLRMMSCYAMYNNIYVVINHYEIVNCTYKTEDCPEDGFLLYNTNVVFDRKGSVIARYRKFSLFYEPWLNTILEPDLSTFTTDFNVTFAQMISLDMMNEKVTRLILQHSNITDVVLSAHQFGKVPFVDSVQDRAAWAYETDLNLLVSGFSRDGSSEVYFGRRGVYKKYLKKNSNNLLIYADIMKKKHSSRSEVDHLKYNTEQNKTTNPSFFAELNAFETEPVPYEFMDNYENILEYFDPELFKSVLLDVNKGWYADELCIPDLCCQFAIHVNFNESYVNNKPYVYYRYRLMVANGLYILGENSLVSTEICAVIGCTSEAIEDCGKTFPDNSKIAPHGVLSLMVTRYANFTDNSFVSPIALANDEIMSIDHNFTYNVRNIDSSKLLLLNLKQPTDNIEFFGIDLRRFDVDAWYLQSKPKDQRRKGFLDQSIIHASYLALIPVYIVGFVIIAAVLMVIYKFELFGKLRSLSLFARRVFVNENESRVSSTDL